MIKSDEIYNIMSPTEAAELWDIKRNTLIAALNRGRFDQQIKSGLIRKYIPKHGKAEWYISKKAMEEIYGPQVQENGRFRPCSK